MPMTSMIMSDHQNTYNIYTDIRDAPGKDKPRLFFSMPHATPP